MKILFLSRWFPYPPNNGARIRVYNLLRVLAQSHQVTLISFNDQPERPAPVDALQSICEQTTVVPWKSYQPTSAKALLGLFNPTPRAVIDTYSPAMAQQIRRTLAEGEFDLVIASQIETASYHALFGDHPAIFEEVEIGVPLERYTHSENLRARLRNGLTWFKHRRYLKRILKRFCACTVASEQERRLLQETGIREQDIALVPNFIELADYQGFHLPEKEHTLIFTGSFRYRLNYEAMVWFVGQIFPLITARFPDLQLVITGDHLGLPLPQHENIRLTGYIADESELRALLASATLSIAPLLSGGGTRLKILEALATKTPVVSTTKGAEGLAVRDGETILIADTPQAFAQAVIRVLQDHSLRDKLTESGFKLVQAQYSTEAVASQYGALLEGLCKP